MCFIRQIILLIFKAEKPNMNTSISLTKTLALAMVSHIVIISASFGMEKDDLNAAMLTASTPIKVEVKDEVVIDIKDIEEQTSLKTSQILNQTSEEASAAANKLDTLIKYGITVGGIAAGGALAYFYCPAIAFTVAYEASLFLASVAVSSPTWYTYNFIIKPAAIDAGVYFATSPLIKTAITASASGLGYVLGKTGCAAYDATKYAASVAGSAGYSLAGKIGSTSSSLMSTGWNWLAGKTLVS